MHFGSSQKAKPARWPEIRATFARPHAFSSVETQKFRIVGSRIGAYVRAMKNASTNSTPCALLLASSLSLTAIVAAGCASTSTTNPRAESSSAAIRAAEEVGGTHSPEAALHLQLAKEQFEYARQLPNPSDKPHADRILMRAQADAELSLALARSETEKAEAQRAIEKVQALKASAAQ